MKRAALILVQVLISALLLGGITKTHFDSQASKVPSWNSTADSSESRKMRAAIIEWLHSQPWANGDSFEIIHASDVFRDFDRYGDNERRSASVMMVDYIRRLERPHGLSAAPSKERFVFVLDTEREVVRRLVVDRLHSPYGDLFSYQN